MNTANMQKKGQEGAEKKKNKLWGGRFSQGMDQLMEKFNNSIGVDKQMWKADVEGSMAYAGALKRAGLLTAEELEITLKGLQQVHDEWSADKFVLVSSDEDIHTANERRLTEIVGATVGGKLHTGRSRNDQCTNDVLMWMKDEIVNIRECVIYLLKVFTDRAEADIEYVMPGYTHLQRAQPIRWSHWLMSYASDFSRDLVKLTNNMHASIDCMTLGSGALAGNPFDIDREQLAEELGFGSISVNSMSATSSRDFIADMLFWSTQIGGHLSRFSEDLIVYSTKEFSFVKLSDAYSTGSSIMPQKKNPDSLELIRGKSGTLIGKLTGFLATMKGLPSTYNKDMQEDKEILFKTCEIVKDMIQIAAGVVETLTVNPDKMLAALSYDMLATDVAYYLVRKGMSFRSAHEISGKVVHKAEVMNCKLNEISLEDLKEISSLFDDDVMNVWDFSNSVEQYRVTGGTSKPSVLKQIKTVRDVITSVEGK